MRKIITYLKGKPLEVFIALLLIFVIFQQYQMNKVAERCQYSEELDGIQAKLKSLYKDERCRCTFELDEIQDGIDDIKSRLNY